MSSALDHGSKQWNGRLQVPVNGRGACEQSAAMLAARGCAVLIAVERLIWSSAPCSHSMDL